MECIGICCLVFRPWTALSQPLIMYVRFAFSGHFHLSLKLKEFTRGTRGGYLGALCGNRYVCIKHFLTTLYDLGSIYAVHMLSRIKKILKQRKQLRLQNDREDIDDRTTPESTVDVQATKMVGYEFIYKQQQSTLLPY